MPKSRFSHDQMRAIVLKMDTARPLIELAREHGVSTATLHRWRRQLTDKRKPAGERLRSLEKEHRRLKNRYAELSLEYLSLRTALVKDVSREC